MYGRRVLYTRNIIKFDLSSGAASVQPPGLFVSAFDVKYFNTSKGLTIDVAITCLVSLHCDTVSCTLQSESNHFNNKCPHSNLGTGRVGEGYPGCGRCSTAP